MTGKNLKTRLAIIAAVFTIIFSQVQTGQAQESAMQDVVRPELFYSVSINAENMFVVPRVNGAPLLTHGRFKPLTLTTDITRELKPGQNQIQIDYEPYDLDRQSFTPHDGVRVQVVLSRSSNFLTSPSIKEQVTLFSGKYATEPDILVQSDDSAFGEGPIIREDGGLRVSGAYELEPITITYTDAQSRGAAMRLTLTFDVSDITMTTPPWADTNMLTDTPALREKLWQAYGQVHSAMLSGDPERFAQAANPLLSHNARVLGYGSAVEFAQQINDREPLAGGENLQVLPFMPAVAAVTSQLAFSSDRRLVQFTSVPLGYETNSGEPAGRFHYWFCQVDEETLAPCFVQDFG